MTLHTIGNSYAQVRNAHGDVIVESSTGYCVLFLKLMEN